MKLKKCPMCNSKKIKYTVKKYEVTVKGRKVVVPRVKRQKCYSCGEEFFDKESNAVLDKYRQRKKLKRAVA